MTDTYIYAAEITSLLSEQRFQEMLAFVPQERQQKALRFRSRQDQCRSLAAGLLLEYGLNRQQLTLLDQGTGIRAELTAGRNGKPCLTGRSDFYFNLSHAGKYVAGIFSGAEVGIDIEQTKKARLSVAKRFFTAEEYSALIAAVPPEQEALFCELWTRKESYVKAIGRGMTLSFASFSALGERVGAEKTFYFKSWRELLPGYCLSVCAEKPVTETVEVLESDRFYCPGNFCQRKQ